MAELVQLIGSGKPRGARTHDRHRLSGAAHWKFGGDPTPLPRHVRDFLFNVLDGHRIPMDAQDARGLAWCWANASSKFREIVGRSQHLIGLFVGPAVHRVVEFRDAVAQGAPAVAKRDAAVHATRSLDGRLLTKPFEMLIEVVHPLLRGADGWLRPSKLKESGVFTHGSIVLVCEVRACTRGGTPRQKGRGDLPNG